MMYRTIVAEVDLKEVNLNIQNALYEAAKEALVTKFKEMLNPNNVNIYSDGGIVKAKFIQTIKSPEHRDRLFPKTLDNAYDIPQPYPINGLIGLDSVISSWAQK